MSNKKKRLDETWRIVAKFVKGKTHLEGCELASDDVVLYSGNPEAKIIVIARDLGADEVEKKEVLIGRAGKKFRQTAEMVGFDVNKDMLLCNTIPLRPMGNKSFSWDAREAMLPVLKQIFLIVRPQFVLALGNEAYRTFYPEAGGILEEAGNMIWCNYFSLDFQVMPCAHPSYVIRGISKEDEIKVFVKPIRLLYREYKKGGN